MDKKTETSPQKAERKVTTNKPLPWPYQAQEARNSAAEQAAKIDRLLGEILEGKPMSEAEMVRKVAQAIIAAKEILRHMEAQGAPTRPQ